MATVRAYHSTFINMYLSTTLTHAANDEWCFWFGLPREAHDVDFSRIRRRPSLAFPMAEKYLLARCHVRSQKSRSANEQNSCIPLSRHSLMPSTRSLARILAKSRRWTRLRELQRRHLVAWDESYLYCNLLHGKQAGCPLFTWPSSQLAANYLVEAEWFAALAEP